MFVYTMNGVYVEGCSRERRGVKLAVDEYNLCSFIAIYFLLLFISV